MRTKKIKQKVVFNAKPSEIFEILTSQRKLSVATNSKVRIKKDGEFSIYFGDIKGKYLRIVPDRKLVQEWKLDKWPKEHTSLLDITLKETKKGCELVLVQEGVPLQTYKDVKNGWNQYYWEPIKQMLEMS